MQTIMPDPSSTQTLQQLVANCPFLRLSSSPEMYPQARGSGLPLLIVETALCSAVISLQGAHLLEFKTTSGDPLLWLSPTCDFTPGTALRGGVPLCLPWFGVHETDRKKPKHGFARNQFWQLADAHLLPGGHIELEFLFASDANQLFPYDFSAEIRMTLGNSAKLEITINNTDTADFDCSWVMHNYFRTQALANVRVEGLAHRNYFDNVGEPEEKHQIGDVGIAGPVDRVYLGIDNNLKIFGAPAIVINHHNCPSVVVWNPGSDDAKNIGDIGAGNEEFFICVERGAVMAEKWHLAAGSSRSAWMEFKQIEVF